MKINSVDFCTEVYNSPRLNELFEKFEQIANGNVQVPYKLPKTAKKYLSKSKDNLRHEKIFQKNLCTFFKHGIASIPYLSEEILRIDNALFEYAKYKGATSNQPLTYWETSSADGTRARTLAEYTDGIIVTLTDSPNVGNKLEFDNSPSHPYSFFHCGPFSDICPEYLVKQKFHSSFRSGFDVIWENTTFQMYGKNRVNQIAYVSQSLKSDGLLILFEKLNADNYRDYVVMEKNKDRFKTRYFKKEQIIDKKKGILDIMELGQVTKKELIDAASQFYKYGVLLWNSTNFYEIVVSNSRENIEKFLSFLPEYYVPKKYRYAKPMVSWLWGKNNDSYNEK